MNVGIIGTGARSCSYKDQILSGVREEVKITAICDIDTDKMKRYAEKHFNKDNMPVMYNSSSELINDPEIDIVLITTSDTSHRDIAIEAIKKNKYILLEKPFATTLKDCIDIYNSSLNYKKLLKAGFVLRYTNVYEKVKAIIDSNVLGKLISIEAKETLGYWHAASFFRRWHRFKKNNGGFLNAKCSHDLDLLNWLTGKMPVYVSSFGSRTFFNKKDEAGENCTECKIKTKCIYNDEKDSNICPFNTEKDIVDHQVVNIEYQDGLTASFTVSMLSAKANRTMIVFGSEATMHVDFDKRLITVNHIAAGNQDTYTLGEAVGGHGGGDNSLYTYFIDTINGADSDFTVLNDIKAGVVSSAIALAAEKSMEDKVVINLMEILPASMYE